MIRREAAFEMKERVLSNAPVGLHLAVDLKRCKRALTLNISIQTRVHGCTFSCLVEVDAIDVEGDAETFAKIKLIAQRFESENMVPDVGIGLTCACCEAVAGVAFRALQLKVLKPNGERFEVGIFTAS